MAAELKACNGTRVIGHCCSTTSERCCNSSTEGSFSSGAKVGGTTNWEPGAWVSHITNLEPGVEVGQTTNWEPGVGVGQTTEESGRGVCRTVNWEPDVVSAWIRTDLGMDQWLRNWYQQGSPPWDQMWCRPEQQMSTSTAVSGNDSLTFFGKHFPHFWLLLLLVFWAAPFYRAETSETCLTKGQGKALQVLPSCCCQTV